MLPKVRQFWNNENNPLLSGKKQGQLRSDRIDKQRGYGTYDPMAGGSRSSIPGTPKSGYETAKRRTTETIPGFSKPMLNNINTPGSGQA